jgi:C4-dicarboxylate transporter DctQ subunit
MTKKGSKNFGFLIFLENFFGYFLPGTCLVIITFGVATEIILRKIFITSLYGLEEFVSMSMITLTFMAMGVIQKNNGHVKMDLVLEKIEEKLRRKIELIGLLFSILMFVFLTYGGVIQVIRLYHQGAITVVREWPIWPYFVALPLGSFLLIIRLSISFFKKLKKE